MIALIGAMLMALAPQDASKAAPVHLTCYLEQPGGTRTMMDITADEASGTVTTFVRSTGYRQRRPAVFRPGDVLFASPVGSYRIDRVDLTFVLTLEITGTERSGKCEVAKVPERAF